MILGCSTDNARKQARFREKHSLPFTLLADVDHQVAMAYGAWQLKKFLGREYMGVNRSTVLIDPNGTVAKVYPKVSPAGHAEEVASDIEALKG